MLITQVLLKTFNTSLQYSDTVPCIRRITQSCVPDTVNGYTNYDVPGWTDCVNKKHEAARAAFLNCVAAGTPDEATSSRVALDLLHQHCDIVVHPLSC